VGKDFADIELQLYSIKRKASTSDVNGYKNERDVALCLFL